ncbi:hypothetical protein M670_00491 [Schinkia azotoformans MEV2011]|uniref:Uncharacterized protein n=1 Tax=Schinkia azotoformans MEV2011 TaxID=1348973 RepID=A0A072P4Q4_SCHAZ|nr:hypothetical protein [Schinkia azotoformans]KEF40465.1 hypothetical protein M670_00491 [Schinkia azotoformans MEV2011]MEC1696126.1 hypothetical protein [Schinkia azotoformans]MEC1716659.1 hypothetical protein [Schinkia azotoformans]MEC1725371.1 hypothetical protein [Schinkia azotoformans]MEC1739498.1 hypothetical protein [Schinkia azotoformans]
MEMELHPSNTYENYRLVVNFMIENDMDEEQMLIIAKMILAHQK